VRAELDAAVRRYMAAVPAGAASEPAPKALIAPHAGYVYSGPVAASAYARLAARRGAISRVVLLGPSHRVYLRGLAAPDVDAFATPLGEVPIDRAWLARALELPQVQVLYRAHELEHSLEVHLPFVQVALGAFSLVPLVTGDASPREVAEVLDALWGGDETLVVVSSDLSHYHGYEQARRQDAETAHAIEALRPDAIGEDDACGRVPIRGLLVAAEKRGLGVRRLDLRSSGDTAGPRDRVVGYGAFAVG
jgi:AmmeMemoRadiSam system protein B